MNETDKLAKILWDYHKLNHQISKADVIVCLGNNEIDRCLARTIDLFNNGLAPIIIFSGGVGPHSKSQVAEADILKEKALKLGIPAPTILVENKSMHTGENMVFTSKLLKDSKIKVSKIIFVTKGNMERRVFATFKKQWLNNKNIKVMVTSPKISYQSYPNKKFSREDLINELVGYTERIIKHFKLGQIIYQKVPKEVLSAYKKLSEVGFNKHNVAISDKKYNKMKESKYE